MLRDTFRRDGWLVPGFMLGWIAIIALAWVIVGTNLACAQPKKKAPVPVPSPVAECVLVEPLWPKLKESGYEFERVTDKKAVAVLTAVLQAIADKPFPRPTEIVVVFLGETAKIGIIVGDRLCAVLTGPAPEIRSILLRFHGQSVSRDSHA